MLKKDIKRGMSLSLFKIRILCPVPSQANYETRPNTSFFNPLLPNQYTHKDFSMTIFLVGYTIQISNQQHQLGESNVYRNIQPKRF